MLCYVSILCSLFGVMRLTKCVVESVLKEMFYELCKAVAWMHSVGLVHRDIKLESKLILNWSFTRY